MTKSSHLIEPPLIQALLCRDQIQRKDAAHTASAESLRPALPSLFQGRVLRDAALVRDKDAADPDGLSSRVSVVEKHQI